MSDTIDMMSSFCGSEVFTEGCSSCLFSVISVEVDYV